MKRNGHDTMRRAEMEERANETTECDAALSGREGMITAGLARKQKEKSELE
jgi:hypothetical protein